MNLPTLPLNFDWNTVRLWGLEITKQLESILIPQPVPDRVTNLRLIAGPGMLRIEWTISNAEKYIIAVSKTAQWTADTGWYIDVGQSNTYTDVIGKDGETRYYWVRPKTGNNLGPLAGPVNGTTLALNVAATLPAATVPITTTIGVATDTGNISTGNFRAQKPINR